jgi:hypothetical protein
MTASIPRGNELAEALRVIRGAVAEAELALEVDPPKVTRALSELAYARAELRWFIDVVECREPVFDPRPERIARQLRQRARSRAKRPPAPVQPTFPGR